MKAIQCVQWKSTGKVQAHPQAVSSICARNGFIVTGSSDASVKIWSIIQGKDESGMNGHSRQNGQTV